MILHYVIRLLYDLCIWQFPWLVAHFPRGLWPSLSAVVFHLPRIFSFLRSALPSICTGDMKKTLCYLCVCPTGEFVKNIYVPDGAHGDPGHLPRSRAAKDGLA